MRNHLKHQVEQPQQATHQTNFVNSLKELYELLERSGVNDFSPGWKQILEEIGGNEILGSELKENIQAILSRNEITPAAALQEINELVSTLEAFKSSIDQTAEGFKGLQIGAEELEEGQCELGYSIPRKYVENKLSSLKKEVSELNFILDNFSEAVTSEKQEVEVRTISSSDFFIYVLVSLAVADVLSYVVERIINNYKTILEIKDLRNRLKEKGVPAKETKGIEEFANKKMKQEIKKIAAKIIKENYKGDDGRKNEITNGVTIALNKIANRIDQGFNIEIRVQSLPEPEEDEKVSKETKDATKIINSIQERYKTLEFIKTEGEPILSLTENVDTRKKR